MIQPNSTGRTDLVSGTLRFTSASIMMIDDDVPTMEVVQAYLEEAGYQKFIQVAEPSKAIHLLEENRPDILLLDLMMPHVSGFDILSAVRQHPKFLRLPVIILTVSTDSEDKHKALDLGATDFLAKPVDPSELRLRMRNILSAKAYQDQLAYYDPLTKLPNRTLFIDRLDLSLKKADRYYEKLALLNIALDNVDRINATFGTEVADQVLCQIAARIKGAIRSVDLVGVITAGDTEVNLYRTEGSSFSLLLERLSGEEKAAIVAERINEAIKEPLQLNNRDIYLTASIGIATYPAESGDSDTLLRHAFSARDYIRRKGGDSFQFASESINDIYVKRRTLESRMRHALKRDEFMLSYQPTVNVGTGVIEGAEVLLRMHDEDGRITFPGDFIALAEETGLIIPIGEWVIQQSCRQIAAWQKECGRPIGLSLNLSAQQFRSNDFLMIIQRVIKDSEIDRKLLTFELTESLLMDNIENTMTSLKFIKDLGIRLSIDDFGMGYSSFNYLRRIPADELKLDRSFISDLSEGAKSCSIVSSVIYLAHNLGLKTVAEGVETEDQLDFLKKKGCDMYQGHLFSGAVPADAFLRLVAAQK